MDDGGGVPLLLRLLLPLRLVLLVLPLLSFLPLVLLPLLPLLLPIDCSCSTSSKLRPVLDAPDGTGRLLVSVSETTNCFFEFCIQCQLAPYTAALVELAFFAAYAFVRLGGIPKRKSVKAPLRLYLLTAVCLGLSQALGKVAFKYLNYATGTILKSAKLVPTLVRPGRYCSPRRRMPFNSSNEDSKRLLMTWRAFGLADSVLHVMGCRCRLTHQTRVQDALDDVAGNICQALDPGHLGGVAEARGAGG